VETAESTGGFANPPAELEKYRGLQCN
jgi:hypothetical protein